MTWDMTNNDIMPEETYFALICDMATFVTHVVVLLAHL